MLFTLLDDHVIQKDLVACTRDFHQALDELNAIEAEQIPSKFVSSSIHGMLLLERAAQCLLSHGIPLNARGSFGAVRSEEGTSVCI